MTAEAQSELFAAIATYPNLALGILVLGGGLMWRWIASNFKQQRRTAEKLANAIAQQNKTIAKLAGSINSAKEATKSLESRMWEVSGELKSAQKIQMETIREVEKCTGKLSAVFRFIDATPRKTEIHK